jgi:uncharacterized protein (DUF697 family)
MEKNISRQENFGENKNSGPEVEAEKITRKASRKNANEIIKKNVLMGAGSGLVPIPIIDSLAIAVIELKMIDELADAYNFPYPSKLATYKALISLVGSIGPIYLASRYHSIFKTVPLVGHLLTAGLLSITGGASVYAVGKVFQKHFESGGVFLSSDNESIKNFYKNEYQEGKKIVPQILAEAKD